MTAVATFNRRIAAQLDAIDKRTRAGVQVLGQQHTSITAPADTNTNTLYSLVIPAGTMGLNDSLRITHAWNCTNNANSKTMTINLGGSGTASTALTSVAGSRGIMMFSNRNSNTAKLASNSCGNNFVGSGSTVINVDTTQAQTLTISVTKTVGGDTITLESVLVELIRAAN